MELFDRINKNAISIVKAFAESPGACTFLSCMFTFTSVCVIRGIVNALLGMHRSSTQLKKLRNNYSFLKKMIMLHIWKECLHAKGFCRLLIICHHFRVLFFLVTLFLLLITHFAPALELVTGRIAGVVCITVDIPLLLLHLLLDRHPFKRLKHEYRFKKYHNTNNRNSLI